jgi:4-hydroxy-3-methylbut-2-enyl diphosphate reductase
VKVLEIITANEAGFCFGVKRAIDIVQDAVSENDTKDVYTLGPLIHNPQVVEDLKEKGVNLVDSVDDIEDGILVIRTHGVEPNVLKKAEEKGIDIIDATCPFVKNAHIYAKELVDNNYQTFIFGDKNHPEVKGIYGHTDNFGVIIESYEELDDIKLKDNVGLVAQTTQSYEEYMEVIEYILPKVKELKVFNTICNTTGNRQEEARELAKKGDVMLVVGGHNSANTKRLAEISTETNTPTFHIETVDELNWDKISNANKIGLTAGASTPDWIIKEVLEIMSEEKKEVENMEEEVKEQDEVKENEEEVQEESEEIVEEVKEEEVNEETDEVTDEVEEDDTEEDSETKEFNYSDNDIADLKKGQKVTGTVVEVNDDGVYVDVGYKTEGFIPKEELNHRKVDDPRDLVEEDEEIEVIILTLENEEGNMILSKKKADYEKAWERIIEAYENDEVLEAEVTKEVKGGLVVDVGVRGFIPASHVAVGYVEDLGDYVNETLKLKVIEVERDKNNVVLSAKKILEEERAEKKEETLENLEEGDNVEGVVTKLVDFGAFIDLGGIEGLLHISEMSWGRIDHPREVLEEGEEVEVKVLGVNEEEERISLGLKQLLPDPWEEFAKKHYEGETIEGKITKIVDFGAFMEVAEGIEGLIHISQLSQKHVETPDEVVEEGEERKAQIINIDPEQRRIGLSLKELEPKQEKQKQQSDNKSKSQNKGQSSENKKQDTPSGATIQELVGDIFDKEEE